MYKRYDWVDNARGLGIFLVIYGHNYPFLESYIYSFHIPLFFFISGMFHPVEKGIHNVIKRAKSILLPYFIWSFLLFGFWVTIGRHYGRSAHNNLDPIKGLIGVIYAQGDVMYMDWGIPMWFLPSIFLTFFIFCGVQSLNNIRSQILIVVFLISAGFLYPYYFSFKLPWSLDVSLVSLVFYVPGFFMKRKLINFNPTNKTMIFTFLLFLITFTALINSKIDMYRSIYGFIPLFIFNGFVGIFFVLLLFKQVKKNKFFGFLGKNTIPLLALQLRAMTVIKLVLVIVGISSFNFNEPIKFGLVFVQIILIFPIIILIDKYLPILNGKVKK